ncbi:globin-coupled sensor protein [Sphingomonas sp. BN140010]|uniref:Globin-coupled sensor protein n=1 Tax=Sphingomonas arvum TaxID=2992113 RepID=A0ABT3JBE2_9SPHN|nr:globin-coupled sensor protein [Sphingomonas sp. BN140010]MCW3796398.1 globin-coupled sensor protein [Sphingomonas sp. BN140010]
MSRELDSRLDFMRFDGQHRQLLKGVQPDVERWIGPALDSFYAQVRGTAEVSSFFRDDSHMASARTAQARHWSRISQARFDNDFHASVRAIGSVHARIGLQPRWYMGAYGLVLDYMLRAIDNEYSWWRRALTFFRKPKGIDVAVTLVKAALLDMELSTSIWYEECQTSREAAIQALGATLAKLSGGDLTENLSGLPASFAMIETHYNNSVAKLRDLIGSVAVSAEQIRTGSAEIAQASEDLARRTESNAASLEQTAAAVSQMDGRLKATASAAQDTVQRADQTKVTVASGRSVADEAVQAMGRVSESAKGIDSVIEGLDKIAFQTRVLAMNAAVEAGRAGEAGRGFAVVADLVSALAMRAEEEAKRARDQLTVTQSDVVTAVQAVEKVDGALQNISGDVEQVHALLATIASDNQAQASAVTEINSAIASMDQATQQNAAMVEETSAASRNLLSEVSTLSDQISRFVVRMRRASQAGSSRAQESSRCPALRRRSWSACRRPRAGTGSSSRVAAGVPVRTAIRLRPAG